MKAIPIGINEVLLFAISGADDVNILKVSWIAPKLSRVNSIASPFHLVINTFQFQCFFNNPQRSVKPDPTCEILQNAREYRMGRA